MYKKYIYLNLKEVVSLMDGAQYHKQGKIKNKYLSIRNIIGVHVL